MCTRRLSEQVLARVCAGAPYPPGDRSVAACLHALSSDGCLSGPELLSNVAIFMLAGMDTTGHSIAYTLWVAGKKRRGKRGAGALWPSWCRAQATCAAVHGMACGIPTHSIYIGVHTRCMAHYVHCSNGRVRRGSWRGVPCTP